MRLVRTPGGLELATEEFLPKGSSSGPPILLVMGLGAQMLLWPTGFCRALADAGHRVIRYDNRDVGASTRLDLPVPNIPRVFMRQKLGRPVHPGYTLSDMGDDAIAVLDHYGLERACVVGASMGGMIVQRLAIEHPERLQSLVSIMSSTTLFLPDWSSIKMLLVRPEPGRDAAIAHTVRWFKVIGSKSLPIDEAAIAQVAAEMFDRGPSPQGFARHLHAIVADGDRSAALAGVSTPSLVIHGDEDSLIPLKHGIATAATMGASLRIVRGMGHDFPPQLWPELVRMVSQHAVEHATPG